MSLVWGGACEVVVGWLWVGWGWLGLNLQQLQGT